MVGDDVEAMTREAREQGEPVIECLTAGFHGDCHYGYETVMTDLIQKLPKVREIVVETDAKLVNLFGILPEKEVYFRGNLEVIKRTLESIGIRVNTFFGSANGVAELANAQNATLNLVFSKWGLAPAKKLEELYHIPALTFSALPIGVEETADFVAQVAAALKIEETLVNAYLDEERKRFDYYYESVLEDAFENGAARTVAVVGDESYIAGVAGFLHTYLGAQIAVAVVTDGADGKTASDVLSNIAKEVYVTADGKEIDDILIHSDVELILGSSLERTAAEKKGVVNLEISSPIYNQTITNKSYAGVDGALTLLEDYLSALQRSAIPPKVFPL
jgi:nitrogenase molybdenum-iron protein beta chain